MSGKPSLNTGSIKTPSLEDKLRIAHEARYSAVGIFESDLRDYLDEGGDVHRIGVLLEELGLEVSEVMAFRGWVTPQPVAEQELVERNAGVLMACEVLGCKVITAPASGADIEVERYVGNFRVACEAVAERGITLAFEFLGKLRVARDLATGLKIVEEVGLPNARLLIDTAHFIASGASMEDLRSTPVERIALIHFEDIAPGSQDTTGEKDRMIPGEGAAPLREGKVTTATTRWSLSVRAMASHWK
jgi:sugar phosphate isomerase/epimerase